MNEFSRRPPHSFIHFNFYFYFHSIHFYFYSIRGDLVGSRSR